MPVRPIRPVSRVSRAVPRRVAMLSVHTSPLDQPGSGDAGGLNVYVAELSRRLAEAGTEVEVFTRATSSEQPPVAELAPGVLVRHLQAGPYEGLSKSDLPGQLCALTAGVLRVEAAHEPGWYDLIHSHYWLSGQVGWLAKERWSVPLVHTMHTMAKVKNLSLAGGESPEPVARAVGEEQVVEVADRLVVNTELEARQLVELYDADPRRLRVVTPGVDLATFQPGPVGGRERARAELGLPPDAPVVLFVGRLQPHKAPDVLVRAVARLRRDRPALVPDLVVAVVGGPSGQGLGEPLALRRLARELGVADAVRFAPPVPHRVLAQWYRAADLTAVPSYSESFGLVALESQACGTPVVAAAVGGLRTAVRDGLGGVLVDGHDPDVWAGVLGDLLADPNRRARLAAGALRHARGFGWAATTGAMLEVYMETLRERGGLAVAVNQ